MQALGKHMLLDLKDCAPVLDDLEFLKEALCSATRQSSMDILGESFYHFSPQGVSGAMLGTGLHICIHTWPEYGYAAVDIYTCNDSFPSEKMAELLLEKLGAKESSIKEVKRGASKSRRIKMPSPELAQQLPKI